MVHQEPDPTAVTLLLLRHWGLEEGREGARVRLGAAPFPAPPDPEAVQDREAGVLGDEVQDHHSPPVVMGNDDGAKEIGVFRPLSQSHLIAAVGPG